MLATCFRTFPLDYFSCNKFVPLHFILTFNWFYIKPTVVWIKLIIKFFDTNKKSDNSNWNLLLRLLPTKFTPLYLTIFKLQWKTIVAIYLWLLENGCYTTETGLFCMHYWLKSDSYNHLGTFLVFLFKFLASVFFLYFSLIFFYIQSFWIL